MSWKGDVYADEEPKNKKWREVITLLQKVELWAKLDRLTLLLLEMPYGIHELPIYKENWRNDMVKHVLVLHQGHKFLV